MTKLYEIYSGMEGYQVTIATILAVLIFGFTAIKIIMVVLEKTLKKVTYLDDALHTFILSAVRASCVIILFSILLSYLGVHMSTIVAVLGAAGAAIALALRDSLANIAGGVMIIVNHPFVQGDLIKVGETRGRVEKIDLFLTTLKTLDYQTITIPNGVINTSVIYNESNRSIRRVDCRFSVAYDTDLEQAKEVLANVCGADPMILDEPATSIGVIAHEDSGIVIEVLAYCKTEDYWNVRYYLMETVKVAFEENGIEIPYPRMDVNVRKVK